MEFNKRGEKMRKADKARKMKELGRVRVKVRGRKRWLNPKKNETAAV